MTNGIVSDLNGDLLFYISQICCNNIEKYGEFQSINLEAFDQVCHKGRVNY